MRYLTALLIGSLVFCSCGTYRTGPTLHDKPFVKTYSGKVMTPEVFKDKNSELKLDNSVVVNKDTVKEYSDGNSTYYHMRKHQFAEKLYDGNLSLYKSTTYYRSTTYAGVTPTSTTYVPHSKFFFRIGDTSGLKVVNYTNLSTVIMPNEPAYKCFKIYDRKITTSRWVKVSAVVLTAACIAIAASSDNDNVAGIAGAGAFLGGPGLYITGVGIKGGILKALFKGMRMHNGYKKD